MANQTSGTVSRIDPAEQRVVATIRVGEEVNAIAAGSGRVWVAVPGEITEQH